MSCVRERPWWPILSPQNGRNKKDKSKEEMGVRSSLLISEMKEEKLQDSGTQEEGSAEC